ncbi:YmdB family metallophosphoesterase [Candidatus Uhrbacteria bacterium]|nr:YmdB family metallophosphoesterase [Candidatus Uhrbacteria bacterium]
MTILVFGDVVGKIGREAVRLVLPKWREHYTPALILANAENLAHGAGITTKTVREMHDMGINVLTGGNHLWDKPAYADVFADPELSPMFVRPLNEVRTVPGVGARLVERGETSFAILNLMGQAFFKDAYPSPFAAVDEALEKIPPEAIVLVDVHAEATSEKALLGKYLDGRATAVWGTHTHVPSADQRLLPRGTAFATDVGMSGAHNESIGIRYDLALALMKDKKKSQLVPPENGPAEVNALLVTLDETSRRAKDILRLREIVEIP